MYQKSEPRRRAAFSRAGAMMWLLLLVVLAGCLGDEVEPEAQESEVPSGDCDGEARTSGSTGAIDGGVSTELFEPLAGTRVLLLDEDRETVEQTVADEHGAFVFCDLAPAFYIVQALRDGYETTLRGANVQPGQVESLRFQMVLLPSDEPYLIEEEIVGLLQRGHRWHVEVPGEGCTDVEGVPTCGTDIQYNSVNWRGLIELDNETKTLLLEMHWDPAGVLGEYLWFDVYCDEVYHVAAGTSGDFGQISDPEHPCYFEPETQSSPVVHRVDEAHWLEHGYNFTDWAWRVYPGYGTLGTYDALGMDLGVGYQQSYTIYKTVFQRGAAPDGFSRLPDA